MILPKPSWVDIGRGAGHRRHRQGRRARRGRRRFRGDRHSGQECAQTSGVRSRPAVAPFLAVGDALGGFEGRYLRRIHQPRVIVLVAGQGQVPALDRVGDEAVRRLIARSGVEGLDQRRHVVTGEIGHQPLELIVVMRREQRRDARGIAEFGFQPRTPAAPPWKVSAE